MKTNPLSATKLSLPQLTTANNSVKQKKQITIRLTNLLTL